MFAKFVNWYGHKFCFTDPLHQTLRHPGVIFYDEPQERIFTSSGGHSDFDNGVEITVPPNIIPQGLSMGIRVQPSLAPKDVFVLPEGIQSASPSYLISKEGSTNLGGEVTLSMEHHVSVPTKEDADDLLFLGAGSSPRRSGSLCVYEYKELVHGRSEFIPGDNKGRLTTAELSKKFLKIGLNTRTRKQSSGGNALTLFE